MLVSNRDTQTAETQKSINPSDALQMLKNGNKRFLNNEPLNRDLHQQVKDTSGGQYPFAAVLSCIDSRIPTEVIFDQGIGDIFNARIAGNFVNADLLGSLEFACKVAGSKLLVVMGHTSCGAVKGAIDFPSLGNLTQMLQHILPAINAVDTEPGVERTVKNADFVNKVAAKNVELNIERIRRESSVLKEMDDNNEIDIVGAMYHVDSGKVTFL